MFATWLDSCLQDDQEPAFSSIANFDRFFDHVSQFVG